MRAFLRFMLGTIVLLAIAVPGWIAIGSRDLRTVDDADLEVVLEPIEPEANAATHLDRLAASLTWLQGRDADLDELRRAESLDRRRATALLPRNSVLDRIDAILAMPRFQIASAAKPSEADVASLKGWQRLGRVLAVRARLRVQAGRNDAAFRDIQRILQLGKRVEGAEGAALIQAVLGTTIREIGLHAAEMAMREVDIDSASSFRLGNQIGQARSDPKSWARVWAVEYQWARDAFEQAFADAAVPGSEWGLEDSAVGRLPRSYLFQPNRTFDRLATRHRRAASPPRGRCANLEDPMTWNPQDPLEKLRVLASRNAGGEILLAIRAPGKERFAYRRCAADARVAALQVRIALEAFESERRTLPDALEQLTPFYLPALPLDPFTGESLRYAKAERLLYSPGSDGVDGGGARPADAPEYVEPVFPIRPPRPLD